MKRLRLNLRSRLVFIRNGDGFDPSSQACGEALPLHAVRWPRREQLSLDFWRPILGPMNQRLSARHTFNSGWWWGRNGPRPCCMYACPPLQLALAHSAVGQDPRCSSDAEIADLHPVLGKDTFCPTKRDSCCLMTITEDFKTG